MKKTFLMDVFCVVILTVLFCISTTNAMEQGDLINFGDALVIKISAEPKMGGTFPIDEQGVLTIMPVDGVDIGQMKVVGLTPKQVKEELSRRLSEYFVNSDCSIILTTSAKFVSIYGQVGSSGALQYKNGMNIMDLLIWAQGLKAEADPTKVSILREDTSEPINLDVSDLVDGISNENNIDLKPGDYVIVPPIRSTTQIKVIALGKVVLPGSVYVSKNSRLMDVYAAAGGSIGRASLGKTYIIRMVDNKPQVIHCDLKQLISRADMTQNVEVKDGDIFFIPESEGVDIMQVVGDVLDMNLLKKTLQNDF